ncbi:MAG: PfkB family carbohydrate kinase [Streptosporangiaceae bacterium]
MLALTGRDDLTAAVKDVLALGTHGVAVTLGAAGCLVASQDQGPPVPLPAIAVDVVDTTGCGDGFTAGLLAGLLLGTTPVDAAWLGIACGSLVATGLGSDAGIEDLGQVVDFLARTLGNDAFRDGAQRVFVTGSFWFSAVPMAAVVATIGALRDEHSIQTMHRTGTQLRDGILAQARSWDLAVRYTGPPAMPYLTFAGDQDHELAAVFATQALRAGAYLHPRHNWFASAALTGDDLALVLEATDQAFAAVRKHRSD